MVIPIQICLKMMRINIVNDELLMHTYSECDVWCFIPDLALLVLDLGSSRQAVIDKEQTFDKSQNSHDRLNVTT